ncbi:enoyl-CoA hydratase [Sulfodiicoccus acidiphilus]|nr:enoyl-CoA hydratase [Sulfodiicoccus acidiphilus]
MARPERRNALNKQLREELLMTLRELNSDPSTKVVVLTGSGGAFSSGADLGSGGTDVMEELDKSFHPILREIRYSDKIYVAVVDGVAAGAGMSLAIACDLRFLSKDARLITAFHRIGLAPDTGLTYILSRLIGARAYKLLLVGGELSAQEAESLGLGKVVEDPLSSALSFAREVAAGPLRSYAASKRMLNLSLFPDLDRFLEYEAMLQASLSKTEDFREGVRAFLEKRTPKYRGE